MNFEDRLRNSYCVEADAKWRPLTKQEIEQEYAWEYAYPSKSGVRRWTGEVFPKSEDFEKAAKSGEVVTLTKDRDKNIEFRSRTSSFEDLKALVMTYRYPRDVDSIVKALKEGTPLPYPIILRNGSKMRVFSGNTRLDAAFILGFEPKVLVVDIPQKD